jgi:hypothetical protein
MKKILIIVLVAALGIYLSGCTKDMDELIVGTWTWTYAQNSSGDNLMEQFDYNTATFNSDGTYSFDIGNASHEGTYTIDNENETINFDGNDPWDITEISSSSLKMKQQDDAWYEFHFTK